jgi:DNA-directed RNA polymerase I and III subunit RPAC2
MSVNEVKIRRAPSAFELRGTGPSTSRTFVLGDEDHTLGNALRHVLINDARVDFCGYCVPHPSEPVVHVRVQCRINNNNSGSSSSSMDPDDPAESLTAIEALKEACQTLSDQCDLVLDKLEEVAPEVVADRIRMEKLAEEENDQEMDDDEEELDEVEE